jgi:hypothetical protein
MSASSGVGEQQRHVLGPDVAAVDPVCRARPPLDPARDLALAFVAILARIPIHQDRDLGEIARRTSRCPGEDHVFHAVAAK